MESEAAESIINDLIDRLYLTTSDINRIYFEYKTVIGGYTRIKGSKKLIIKRDEEELATYNIKKADEPGHDPEEVERSETASKLKLGPRVIYKNNEELVIIEEWFPEGTQIEKRAGALTEQEKVLVAQRFAEKLWMMISAEQEGGTVAHFGDRLVTHIYIIGEGEDIDVRFIDWGKGRDLSGSDGKRYSYFIRLMGAIIDQLRLHFKDEPENLTIYFIKRLIKEAKIKDSIRETMDEQLFLSRSYCKMRQDRMDLLGLGRQYKEFYAQIEQDEAVAWLLKLDNEIIMGDRDSKIVRIRTGRN